VTLLAEIGRGVEVHAMRDDAIQRAIDHLAARNGR